MSLEVRVEEMPEAELPVVDYRWDADTEILCATLRTGGVSEGLTGSLDIEGGDGAWLTLELTDGRLGAVEVAVWPEVKTVVGLAAPDGATPSRIRIPTRSSQPGLAAVEVDTPIRAVADQAGRTIHFRIGPRRATRALRVAGDLLLEVDTKSHIAGLWLLNVPPSPDRQ
ncbi:MAG: hypothetical protein WD771_02700 [Gemmatimonadaceae bacterium]